MIGLYIHLPFCKKKCHYCNYVISLQNNSKAYSDFISALRLQVQESYRIYGPLVFDTVYFGGGTPSILPVDQFAEIMGLLRQFFSWKDGAEVTCEVNPDDHDMDKWTTYKKLGVNRISVGAQSFVDKELTNMGRVHNSSQIVEMMTDLQKLDFSNISLDLIVRLPDQTHESLLHSLNQAVNYGAKQIVIYDLNIHDRTVFGALHQQAKLKLPSEKGHLHMMSQIEEALVVRNNFVRYEISSFALPGYESRHNLIYWKNQPYLGLGPGAFSYMKDERYQFSSTVERYLKKCRFGDWTHDECDHIDPKTKELESLMTGLRLKEGICLEDLKLIHDQVKSTALKLEGGGLVHINNDRLTLTQKGKNLAETVFEEFSLFEDELGSR